MENGNGTLTIQKPEADLREEWLKARQSGIGGSDAAAVLGLSPWKSALALWSEKCGLVSEPNLDELEYIEWGQVLEEPIARKYVRVTGRTLVDPGRFAIRKHPSIDFMHCTIDREIMQDSVSEVPVNSPGDLSIKNVGFFKRAEWEEEPPLQYQIQLQHELVVTGLQWGSFAVLIGGQKFAWLDVPRNDRFISMLIEKEGEFWEKVLCGIPPEPDASDSTKEVLLRLYPKDTGESKALPANFTTLAARRRALKTGEKNINAMLQGVENQIKAAIGDATIGLLPDGSGFSWKYIEKSSYTVKAAKYRSLREIKAGKGK